MHARMKWKWMVLAPLLLTWTWVFTGCQGFPGPPAQKVEANRTSSAGGCAAPGSPGVRICEPPFSTAENSPVQLNASATAGQGRVIQMQVFSDGQKIAQMHGNRFDAPITLSTGTHTLTVVARETGGSSLPPASVSPEIVGSTVGESCPPPSSPGVNVCEPAPGTTCAVQSWVTFVASGTAQTGTVREMQLWINGVNVANFPGNSLNTNLVSDIFGTIKIVEVDSKGQSIASPVINFEGPC